MKSLWFFRPFAGPLPPLRRVVLGGTRLLLLLGLSLGLSLSVSGEEKPFETFRKGLLRELSEEFASLEALFWRGEYGEVLERAPGLPLRVAGSSPALALARGYRSLLESQVASRRGFDEEALGKALEARSFFEKTASSDEELLALEVILRSLHALGLERERRALEEELAVFSRTFPEKHVASLVLLHRGIRAFEARNCSEARQLWRACAEESRNLDNPEIHGLALKHAARCAWLEGRGASALEEYAEALEFARHRGSPWLECVIALEYAEVLVRFRGDYAEAEALLLGALNFAEHLKLGSPLLWICNNLGALYLDIGSFSRGEEILEKARILERRPGIPRDVGLLVNLGSAALGVGDFHKSREYWLEARTLALETGEEDALPGIALNVGILAAKRGAYAEAGDLFAEALAGFHALGAERDAAGVMLQLGGLLITLGEPRQAREALGEAKRAYSSLKDASGSAYVQLQEGKLALLEKNFSRGGRIFEDLLQRAVALGSLELQLGALEGLGLSRLGERNFPKALQALEKGVGLLEEERRGYAFVDRRVAYLDYAASLYELLFETRLDLQDLPGALEVLEHLKARSFLDLMNPREIALHPREEILLRALEVLEVERGLLEKRRAYLLKKELSPENPEAGGNAEIQALGEALERNREKAVLLEKELAGASPQIAALAPGAPKTPEEIRESLPENCTFLHYYYSPRRGGVLLVRRDSLRWISLEGTSESLKNRILSVMPFLSDADAPIPREELRELHAVLMGPLEEFLPQGDLVVVIPHGALGYLPLETLLRGDRYLVETHTLSYAPSLPTSLALLEARKGTGAFPRSALFAGNPAYPDPSLPPLPAAEEEARLMGQFFPRSLVLTGGKATETAIKREAPFWELLHWATHARADSEASLNGEILFAPDENNDGSLRAWEIFSMTFQAECVILSACETGLGKLSPQEGLLGFVRSFVAAGVPSLVASLWSVYDLSTRDFFLAFYTYWKGGASKAQALQKAKIRLRTTYEHPAFWAPFILYGW